METDDIWLAGFLSANGSFTVVSSPRGRKYVRLSVTSLVFHSTIERFALITGSKVTKLPSGGSKVAIQGRPLHEIMTRVWPELSREQKQRYAWARKALKPKE